MKTYTERLFKGSAFLMAATLLASFIGYLTRIVLARNLSPAEYGLFYAVFAFVSFFLFFRDLGLNQAMVKFIPELKIKKKYSEIKTTLVSIFTWQSISTLIMGTFFFILSDFLAENYFRDSNASLMLKLFVIYVIFSMIFLFLQSFFQGFQKIYSYSSAEFSRTMIMFVLIFVFFWLGQGVFAPAYAFVLSWVIMSLVMFPIAVRTFNFFKFKIVDFWGITKKAFAFGFPVMLANASARLLTKIDVIILTYFTTLEQVGIYNVVMPTALLFLFLAESAGAVAFPMISELWAKQDKAKLKEWMKIVYIYSFVIATPVLLMVFSFPKFLINLLFGVDYISGATALQILLVAVIFMIASSLSITTLLGIGKPAIATKIILFASVSTVVLNLILVPLFGINGAASALLFNYFIMFLLFTRQTSKFVNVKLPLISWTKIVFASTIFVFLVYEVKKQLLLNNWIELAISLVLGGAVYLLLILKITKVVDLNEVKGHLALLK
ncbi:flippase [Candidatus Woesearchaeota archaeon]|nr:flippase [Candidatus Woesearchaeota archaeon]